MSWTQTLTNEIITSVEWCPNDPNIAYAGGREHFYRSDDGGLTWTMVSGQNYYWGPPGTVAGFPIDILVDPDDSFTLFVNNYGGGTVKSTDGGVTWTIASQGYTGAMLYDVSTHPMGSRHRVYHGKNGHISHPERGRYLGRVDLPSCRADRDLFCRSKAG